MTSSQKEYRVTLGWGDQHNVSIVKNDEILQVIIDGEKIFKVDEIKIKGSEILVKINNVPYVVRFENSLNTMYINGELLLIKSVEERKSDSLVMKTSVSLMTTYEKDLIMSPMPGRIIKILVKPGSQVKKGQPLLVIESMKMENIISSDRDGIIKEILIPLGSTVNKGSPLIRFSS
ncbi:MAG: biotin/lipoyl-containing protein [Thermoprotei archaeon]|jgi:biotin carboxyl carrier protein